MFDFLIPGAFSYYPILSKTIGSVKAGYFLSYLIYKNNNNGSLSKTIKEVEDDTGLSRNEQETAIKRLKRLGILTVEVKGQPPKRFFKINFERLGELVEMYKENFA